MRPAGSNSVKKRVSPVRFARNLDFKIDDFRYTEFQYEWRIWLSFTDPRSDWFDRKTDKNGQNSNKNSERVFKLLGRYISFISTRFRISFSLNSKIWTSYFHCITRGCFFMSFWYDVSLDSIHFVPTSFFKNGYHNRLTWITK